jgi:two-component system chemotaxis response regulator CheY
MEMARVDLSGLDLLVVDDNKFIRRLMSEILRSFGVRSIREADSAAGAFQEVKQRSPDVIFCDWMMGSFSGLNFLQQIRNADRQSKVPVIMVSGHATTDHVSEALGEGADSYIVKPFTAATLMAHLLKVIAASDTVYAID